MSLPQKGRKRGGLKWWEGDRRITPEGWGLVGVWLGSWQGPTRPGRHPFSFGGVFVMWVDRAFLLPAPVSGVVCRGPL